MKDQEALTVVEEKRHSLKLIHQNKIEDLWRTIDVLRAEVADEEDIRVSIPLMEKIVKMHETVVNLERKVQGLTDSRSELLVGVIHVPVKSEKGGWVNDALAEVLDAKRLDVPE